MYQRGYLMPDIDFNPDPPMIPTVNILLGGEKVLTFTRDIDGKVVAILGDGFTYDDAARTFVGALKPYLEALINHPDEHPDPWGRYRFDMPDDWNPPRPLINSGIVEHPRGVLIFDEIREWPR